MIMDKQLMFEEAVSMIGGKFAVGTQLSTNTIDLRASGLIPGPGNTAGNGVISDPGRNWNGLKVFAQIVTTCTSGGATPTTIRVVTADDAALSTNLTIIQETTTIALATMVAGYQFRFDELPPGITQRFLGLQYTVGTTTFTAGAFTAGLLVDKQTAASVL